MKKGYQKDLTFDLCSSGVINNIQHNLQSQVTSKVINLIINQYQLGATTPSIFDLVGSNNVDDEMYQIANTLDEEGANYTSMLTAKLLDIVKIKIDVPELQQCMCEVEMAAKHNIVIQQLVEEGAPFPLLSSLFRMTEKSFRHIRKRHFSLGSGLGLTNSRHSGGRPNRLADEQIDLVMNSWNYHCERFTKRGNYTSSSVKSLIGDVILSVYRETLVPIASFWPLLDKRISEIVETFDLSSNKIATLRIVSEETVIALSPVQKQV